MYIGAITLHVHVGVYVGVPLKCVQISYQSSYLHVSTLSVVLRYSYPSACYAHTIVAMYTTWVLATLDTHTKKVTYLV